MYTAFYNQQSMDANSRSLGSHGKVDSVCASMITALKSINFNKWDLGYTFVKQKLLFQVHASMRA